jgi:hypothetical protein
MKLIGGIFIRRMFAGRRHAFLGTSTYPLFDNIGWTCLRSVEMNIGIFPVKHNTRATASPSGKITNSRAATEVTIAENQMTAKEQRTDVSECTKVNIDDVMRICEISANAPQSVTRPIAVSTTPYEDERKKVP